MFGARFGAGRLVQGRRSLIFEAVRPGRYTGHMCSMDTSPTKELLNVQIDGCFFGFVDCGPLSTHIACCYLQYDTFDTRCSQHLNTRSFADASDILDRANKILEVAPFVRVSSQILFRAPVHLRPVPRCGDRPCGDLYALVDAY